MSNAELSESVYALLRAAGELSAAQAALDRDHELTTAPWPEVTENSLLGNPAD